jgi:hypothetical protein
MKRMLFLLTIVGFALSTQAAYAADRKKAEIDKMDFNDEKLVDPNLSPDQGSIMAREAPVRTVLVRPRTSFIAELLKTIENL